MARMQKIALIVIGLLAPALAGCVGSSGEDAPDTADQATQTATFGVETPNASAEATAGVPFDLAVLVTGEDAAPSDHVGAHYGTSSSTTPSTKVYTGACEHKSQTVPATVTVSCTFPDAGTYYLRGHARVTVDDTQADYWGPEVVVKVAAPPGMVTITTPDVPASLVAGETFTFSLTMASDLSERSDHVGAHYGTVSSEEPSTQVYDMACDHQSSAVPSDVKVTCTIREAGVYYLRGHVRLMMDGEQADYWGPEQTIEVTAGASAPPSFEVTTGAMPETVTAGNVFSFTVTANGAPAWESTHIGAHYGWSPTEEPSTDAYDGACDHQAGTLPGTFTVTCTILEPGTLYLRGHVRIAYEGQDRDYWGPETMIVAEEG